RLPYTDEPVPYDEEAAEELLKEALRAVGRDPEREKLGEVAREAERARLAAEGTWAPGWRTSPKTRELVEAYERLLFERNAVDFAGMVAFPLRIFGLGSEALELYPTGYRYVLVDEYQDTSQVQYEILRRLGELHRNLTAVGDRLQSIVRHVGA
ncbi:MAG: UvrD-helicase domain-containing protein, partial [Chloroflexota bacterium]|nr:UvrD-helicase domain-containing protein [Chloroflexota bacterium]